MIAEALYKEGNLKITRANFLENFDDFVAIIKGSDEFKKLSDCTQIIFNNNNINDKVHNRQTHTLRVAEISKLIAKKFGLPIYEQKLAELIGLCHDLGHTALGHTGESRIERVLEFYKLSQEEFAMYYMKKYDNNKFEEMPRRNETAEHYFEHHAHSTRVLRKILKDANVEVADDILDELEMGILLHSESRSDKVTIDRALYTIPRTADKSYAFTDVYDIVRSGNNIPRDIFDQIKDDDKTKIYLLKQGIFIDFEDTKKSKEELIKFVKNYEHNLTDYEIEKIINNAAMLNESEMTKVNTILDGFEEQPQETLEVCIDDYIEGIYLEYNQQDSSYGINKNHDMMRVMRCFQAIVKYMRKEMIIGKEEKLANAMVDEIISYKIREYLDKNVDERKAVLEACVFITELKDTELRKLYNEISQKDEWINHFDEKIADDSYKGFETKILLEERQIIRKNPDIILNYYFNDEIKKVKNNSAKIKLYRKLLLYREKPTLEERRELIELIEKAKNGENPFDRKQKTLDR